MSEQRLETDVVYHHDKYGEVLLTGIAKMYQEWDTRGPQEDIASGEVLVFFYDNFDGYGGMNPMPLSEPVNEFAKQGERLRPHETVDMSEWENTAVDPRDERDE